MTRASLLACVLLATILGGCDLPFGVGSGEEGDGSEVRDRVELESGLVARLYAPERVASGDSFRVRFTAQNVMEEPIQVQTGACWGQPAAFLNGEQVPLVCSFQVCTMQLLTWTLPGKETRERTFNMKASLNASSGTPETEEPAEPGVYTLRTRLDWSVGGQKVEERLEADVRIIGQE
ncbi:hypothetical protein BSZ35_19225 [Salinibacter sp. 10B]|uniref:hypothetical protein n=1 Tax=Salinibacter sp. 10B TaxID=1923971 RepID=UPI000CF3DF62|nr:hypothetical protein [Salinibacter sp. 10B]PQJ26724.1 hypothetical protein BSZ35_19225 [Salinibacter sp. 10B]